MRKLIFFVLIIFSCYFVWCLFQPYRIVGIYQKTLYKEILDQDVKYTIVVVDNPPKNHSGMISMWNKEKDTIMSSNPLENKYDHVIFVSNKFEPPHSPEELKFWFGDYQICFSGSVNGKCISKDDRIFYISLWRMEPSSEYIGKYNNKNLYIDYISQ